MRVYLEKIFRKSGDHNIDYYPTVKAHMRWRKVCNGALAGGFVGAVVGGSQTTALFDGAVLGDL
jgi:hypothetical protein